MKRNRKARGTELLGILKAFRLPAAPCAAGVFDAIAQAGREVCGRPVRLKPFHFPDGVASGVCVELDTHYLVAFEKHTDVAHQLVIIGHELWHALQGHCRTHSVHRAATRTEPGKDAESEIEQLLHRLHAADAPGEPQPLGQAALRVVMRSHCDAAHERDAEEFGLQFGTAVGALLEAAHQHGVAGRIQTAMGRAFPHL
ncbi:hypothetical protein ABZ705_12805 [Streptomyces sp. NPDC006984]|uniref:hypothetical protein n=1 Tax=Streptomyces sp. NPDC006984 TaxID=3155463 RepID=UPI0034046D5C